MRSARYGAMRPIRPRRLGDNSLWDTLFGSSAISYNPQLQQYSQSQILDAYSLLYQSYQSENQDFIQMAQWASTANMSLLSTSDQQAYLSALRDEQSVVDGLYKGVAQLQAVMQAMNIQGVPGLNGVRHYGRLGAIPVAIIAVSAAIIAIAIGVGMWAYYQSLSAQAHETTLQLQGKIQQAAIDAGWTPQQVDNLAKQQADANKKPFLDSIPWGTLAVTTVAVFAIKAMFD